jgi:hypothetical protein
MFPDYGFSTLEIPSRTQIERESVRPGPGEPPFRGSQIVGWIDGAMRLRADDAEFTRIREEVFVLTSRFPIPE